MGSIQAGKSGKSERRALYSKVTLQTKVGKVRKTERPKDNPPQLTSHTRFLFYILNDPLPTHDSQIPPRLLLPLQCFKQGLKIPLAKTFRTFSLNDFKKQSRSVFQWFAEYL